MGFSGGKDVFLDSPVIGEETDLSNSAMEGGTVIFSVSVGHFYVWSIIY